MERDDKQQGCRDAQPRRDQKQPLEVDVAGRGAEPIGQAAPQEASKERPQSENQQVLPRPMLMAGMIQFAASPARSRNVLVNWK